MEKSFESSSLDETKQVAERIGKKLRGGEVIELISDLGGGKTSFVSGLAEGFGAKDPVSSPSFTISNVYTRPDGKELHHFDFYRLNEPGIIANELAEIENDENAVIAVEWGGIVHSVLPKERVVIKIVAHSETGRVITVSYAEGFSYLFSD